MLAEEESPVEAFDRALRRWWLVVILTLAGGLLGLGFHRIQPPVYEADAIITVNIDLVQSGPMDELERDQAIGAAKSVLISTPVMQQLTAEAQGQGILAAALSLNRSLFLEREQAQLILRVRNTNPQQAAAIADLWASGAYAALVEAHQHALQARLLRDYLKALESCPPPPAADPPPPSICGNAALAEIRQNIQTAQTQLETETLASRGVIPALVLDWTQKASMPTEPVADSTSLFAIAGALIGFVLGVGLATLVRAEGGRRKAEG